VAGPRELKGEGRGLDALKESRKRAERDGLSRAELKPKLSRIDSAGSRSTEKPVGERLRRAGRSGFEQKSSRSVPKDRADESLKVRNVLNQSASKVHMVRDVEVDPRKFQVGPAGVFEPPPVNKAPYQMAPKDAVLFHGADPHQTEVMQGPIGNCFDEAPRASLAHDDPDLIKQHIREAGIAVNDAKLYATLHFVPAADRKTVAKFQRAADDVVGVDEDGKEYRYTPVWEIISDMIPEYPKDGTPDATSIHIPHEGDVMWNFLGEKGDAAFHGKTGYRDINNGGDSATVFQSIAGRPAKTFTLVRDADPKKDRALSEAQWNQIYKPKDAGKSVALGTWGNARAAEKKAQLDNDSIKRQIRDFPQYDPTGKVVPSDKAYWSPKFVFSDGAGDANHKVKTVVQSSDGSGWVGDHEYSGPRAWIGDFTDAKGKVWKNVRMVETRNPWGDVRPEDFKDLKKNPDGMVEIPWEWARVLYGTASVGGRAKNDRKPLQNVRAPVLPANAKKNTFKLLPGETAAPR
jgi:hypothetical protein